MKLQEKYKSLFEKYGLVTDLRISHFMAQIEHESGLKPISENLNYNSLGLLKTFPKYFGNEIMLTHGYERKPIKIANRVYANRMGNGDEKSGEGWKYRGRGFIQITGKENYHRLSNDTDIDFLHNPDLLLEEANAMISALWFWKIKGLNKFADANDILTITKRINGGINGLEHRKELLEKYLG
jgi:putative chitinase